MPVLSIVGSDWLKDGAYYVNYVRDGLEWSADAQLSFSEPDMPLEIKVGTKKVAPISVGTSNTEKYNIIEKNDAATVQSVLIGQSLDFFTNWGDENTVTIYRVEGDWVEWTKTAEPGNILKIVGSAWLKDGAYYVNYVRDGLEWSADAQLSFSEPDMPLKLKVCTKGVSYIAVGTHLTVDTGGMNLFPEDQVDLVIKGPDGQIKYDNVNLQQFTDITVAELNDKYGDNNFETKEWTIGAYTFKVETNSEHACGLEAESVVRPLLILKGKIAIEADTTSAVELDTVKLTVAGVANDEIKVEASPLSRHVIFKAGIEDTPLDAADHPSWFNDVIDADGIRKYTVAFTDTGTYRR